MKQTFKQRPISSFAALLVFGLFATSILCVLFSGVGVSRRLAQQGQESYARRTCAQYVATKVRQCGSADDVSVESFGDENALVLRQEIDGAVYLTRVYCHDGWLMELFSSRDGEFAPEDGEKLLQAQDLELGLEDGLLRIRIVDEHGGESQLDFSLRGGKGNGP